MLTLFCRPDELPLLLASLRARARTLRELAHVTPAAHPWLLADARSCDDLARRLDIQAGQTTSAAAPPGVIRT